MTLSDGSQLPFGLCVWNTGIAPQPFVKGLPEGTLRTDKWGHVVRSNIILPEGRPVCCQKEALWSGPASVAPPAPG